ncbi:MAG: alanine--tRNA ligase [Oscillospiraceae bacterium]|nr:alanine--tRNA ligase [Oscillospiraceae bacterium]
MKKYGLNELREMFLVFFEEKEHLRLPGFPLVPKGDASLLLINSGMAPMKTWFSGEAEPPKRRVCTCQKCIRTNDIESVGKTSRHGSYFEMLGNFSFGDYFKEESLVWSWEFLTERIGLDENLLYPSVYFEDDEAFKIWTDKIGVAPERVYKLGKEDNFWDHGSGPCGPCSEIYFDRGIENGCGKTDCAPGCECDRFVEIWNNVFTQFNNDGEGNYSDLAQKNIDTGMGLERLACVCQGVDSLFEVDTIMSIVQKVSALSGTEYGNGADSDVSIRIITDHIRSSTMLICDGVLPSNEGRGYVLRRLLRRAARHGRLLSIDGLFLYELCDVVISLNETAYPDLADKAEFIKRVIKIEEESFSKTIDAGTTMLMGLADGLKASKSSVLPAADAFKLYDTYGFPLDLTIDILAEQGLSVDEDGFKEHMEEQRARARKAREAMGDLAWASIDLGLPNTPTVFTGFEKYSDTGEILAIVSQGELCSSFSAGESGIIVLDKTPFYAEMGGQSADFGTISCSDAVFDVSGVEVSGGEKYLHHGKMRSGTLSVGDIVSSELDEKRRSAIKRAHTATHIMHEVLRRVLGDHVNQAGSLVEPDKLRFDFTHFSALTAEELSNIEALVNEAILSGHNVSVKEMSIDDAKKLGATALFGEKYGDTVRVVQAGDSVELCGGTHLDNTSLVGAFSISSEFSVASGVRRIEAITGTVTLDAFNATRKQLSEIATLLKANTADDAVTKLEQNLIMLKDLRSKLEAQSSRESGDKALNLLSGAKSVGNLKVLAMAVSDVSVDGLRQMQDSLREREPNIVSVLALVMGDKVTITATCGKNAVASGVKAGDIIREISKIGGGSGGGKPEFAMGGIKDAGKLDEVLDAVLPFCAKP